MDENLLKHINSPEDLKGLSKGELIILAQELRDFVIDIVATKEGHLGASLGVVELTLAIHKVFNTPEDKLIWDVGHQAYIHKIITGRKDRFHTNREFGGISGFPKREESIYDDFGTGHSSTSISAILGMAIASKINGNLDRQHIAVIGDASIASGMAFEAMNHAGVSGANMLIILNDNEMGIDPNVGALKDYLTKIKQDTDPGLPNIFDHLNLDYFGPVDGHDLPLLIGQLERLKDIEGPKLLHVVTKKGKGLEPAEKDQVTYHAPGKFDPKTGNLIAKSSLEKRTKFQDVFGKTLVDIGLKNDKVIGITPAMPTGSSLKYFIDVFPERAFDVGISEQHAVTFAAGLATQGFKPYCAIYSTFLQRAYDQVIHDVALQNLPVIFCIDRAGIVGQDGPTHHGAFDIAYLRTVPNLILYAPATAYDLRNILYTASLESFKQPIAIRYPRGYAEEIDWQKRFKKIPFKKAHYNQVGTEIAVIGIGTANYIVNSILQEFEEGLISHLQLTYIKPLDEKKLKDIYLGHHTVIILEDGALMGGASSAILELFNTFKVAQNPEVITLGIPDKFLEHGASDELKKSINLDQASLKKIIQEKLQA